MKWTDAFFSGCIESVEGFFGYQAVKYAFPCARSNYPTIKNIAQFDERRRGPFATFTAQVGGLIFLAADDLLWQAAQIDML